MVVMGVFYLVMAVVMAVGLYEDWSEWRLLNEKGEVRTVPLLSVEKDSSGKTTVYEAAYQFNDSTREQVINKHQYERLKSQDSVEILAYEDASMIVGSKPRYDLIVFIMGLGAMGVLFTGTMTVVLLRVIWKRSGCQRRFALERKHREEI